MGVKLISKLILMSLWVGASVSSPTVFAAEKSGDNLDGSVFAAGTIPDNDLEKKRGAELVEAELTGAVLDAVSSNNVAIGTTGSNSIGQGAFGHADGVVSVIQNTGNNVVIQSATVVNLKLTD